MILDLVILSTYFFSTMYPEIVLLLNRNILNAKYLKVRSIIKYQLALPDADGL